MRRDINGIIGTSAMIHALCLACSLASSLRGDIYEAIQVTSNHSATVVYKYGHHGSLRLRSTGNFRNLHTYVWNQERQTTYELDPAAREYREAPKPDLILVFARRIARPRTNQSGKTVNIYYETSDTGERQQILGHTAKHLRFRERQVAEPGACVSSSLREDDGWYVDFPEQDPGSLITIANQPVYSDYEVGQSYGCRDTVRKHGEPPSGLLVFQEKKAFTLEMIALSNAPLDRSLFEVPGNYKKVDHFKGEVPPTWTDRLSWEWDQLVDSIATWF